MSGVMLTSFMSTGAASVAVKTSVQCVLAESGDVALHSCTDQLLPMLGKIHG